MKKMVMVLLGFVLVSCATAGTIEGGPVGTLVKELNESNGLWINGRASVIDLPQDAEPEEILAEALKTAGFSGGHIETYEIRETRQVQLNTGQMETFTAILIDSDLGAKIFLCKYEQSNQWWGRFFDVPNE
jgi:hypothetical protein